MSNLVRSVATAILTPILFSLRTGHWKSSFAMLAVSRRGDPLPWYTYPCIDFLKQRDYASRTILEFGAGQSTLWWARKAARVVSLEGDESWLQRLKPRAPQNVELHLVPTHETTACVDAVNRILAGRADAQFDVVIIDGLRRSDMIAIAARAVKPDGIIVCDNAEGYGFFEGFKDRGFRRVDFFGNAPGVVLPHCTAVYFRDRSFAFEPSYPIPDIAKD